PPPEPAPAPPAAAARPYSCQSCGKRFRRAETLRRHTRYHLVGLVPAPLCSLLLTSMV
uniref:C2H2-type domain-containing protein n=1 Tax=Gadus morhua TaxID=8049 RepID=A0A8C5C7P3_GADMO